MRRLSDFILHKDFSKMLNDKKRKHMVSAFFIVCVRQVAACQWHAFSNDRSEAEIEPTTFWFVARQTHQYSCGFAGILGDTMGTFTFSYNRLLQYSSAFQSFSHQNISDRFFDSYNFSTWGQIGDTNNRLQKATSFFIIPFNIL